MRTLKKALSLVLVLAMVLSLGVSAFAVEKAADFTDYSTVTNKEAVDVLAKLGVVNGNDDGSFGPTGNFTRAQAAVIISYLTLGTKVANALPTSATQFNDVPATHWSAKYVQYCASQGIINGYGDGNFGPDAPLTSSQWALMLLGALGYNAKNEQIGGTGWEIATTRLAINAGVATADDLTATFNRDMAAKMALNTLKADLVEYKSNGTNITVGDTTISTGASAASKVETSKETAGFDGKKDGIMQFVEQNFPKLKMAANGTDEFGRTQNTWTLDGAEIGSYTTSNATLSYTGKVKASDIYKDLGRVKITVDNVDVSGNTDDVAAEISSSSKATFGGANCAVEVYYDSEEKTADIVVVKYVVAEVTKVTAEKTDKNGDVTPANITVKTLGDKIPTTFDTAAFAKGDIVLVAATSEKIVEVLAADSIEGTATATRGTNVTISGTVYTNNAGVARFDKGTFYLGVDGSIVYAKATSTASDDYAYVYSTKENKGDKNDVGLGVDGSVTAYVVLANGDIASYTVAKEDVAAFTEGKVVCYVINSDGEIALGTPSENATVTAQAAVTFGKGQAKMGSYYASSATNFVFVNINEAKATITTSTATGYSNVAKATEQVIMVADTETARVTTAFVLAAAPSDTAENTAILLDAAYTEDSDEDNKAVYVYSVLVDGVETELTSKTKLAAATTANVGKLFTYTEADGYVTAFDLKANAVTGVKATAVIDNYIVVNGNAIDLTDDCVIYNVEVDDDNVATVSSSSLEVGDTFTYYLGKGDNAEKIAIILITEVAE